MIDYEILLMLDPELPDDRQNEIVERVHENIERAGGSWGGHDVWGRRRLAYEIDHKAEGVYHLLTFDAEPEALAEVSRVLKITVWGNQGESCAQYLAKGRPVAVDGRLEWREWDAQDGTKRQAVEIIADSVQFLGGRTDAEGGQPQFVPAGAAAQTENADFAAGADDDIPF